ncbi:MAG: molybdopterin-dependent oxidoreductase [Anaerolineaceae bacterium]|nr:molybdopterin-dependent oxidoreductase [Anaerolineaceae bacterium]
MSDFIQVQLFVNGQSIQANVPSNQKLMEFLRNDLGLVSVKNGCATGHCGTCTVVINGKAERSCLVLMKRVNGCVIETIENLTPAEGLHPLQFTFITENAVQCGFCTPGMLLASKALLDQNTKPSELEIRHALRNNLCRCTGYSSIIRAVQNAGKILQKGTQNIPIELINQPDSQSGLMGVENPDKHAFDGVTGRLNYADDRKKEKLLYGKIKFSDLPSARILNINASEVMQLSGVQLVLTGKDVLGTNMVGMLRRDQPAIAEEHVRSVGDIVAVVFADTEDIAKQALNALRVDYEPLPGVFSPQDAMQSDAPLIHESGNICHKSFLKRGNVDAAFQDAAVVVEGDFTTPFVDHAFLEPESGIAYPDGKGGIILELGTQCPFDDRTQIAEALDLPLETVRVRQVPMGGAFGGREDICLHVVLVLGALKTGRAVKVTLSREESFRAHPKRHATWMKYKLAADPKGKFLAIRADIHADTGAYASLGPDIIENMLTFGAGPYFIPDVDLNVTAWYTNNIQAGAMRGFGVPQVAFAIEQLVDEVARKLNLDPFDIRLLNALDVGLALPSDHILEYSIGIKETLRSTRQALQEINLNENGKKIGVGVASSLKNIGFGHGFKETAGAIAELLEDGTFLIRVGMTDFGQGAFSAMAQLAGHELGANYNQVKVLYADTSDSPETGPTTASRQTFLSGNAVVLASRELKAKILELISEELNLPSDQIDIEQGMVVIKPTGEKMELSSLGVHLSARSIYHAPLTLPFTEEVSPGVPDRPHSRATHFTYSYGTHVAIVEVDEKTGKVSVQTIIAAHDVGNAINPKIIRGQIEGGAIMGMGYGLSEEFIIENGIIKTDTLRKCNLTTIQESPQIIPIIVENPDPNGPFGAKGMAEASILPTAAALANAIYDAVGVRIYDLPAKPKKILAALQSRKEIDD